MLVTAHGAIELHLLELRHAAQLCALADGWNYQPQVNEWLFPGNTVEAAESFIKAGLLNLAEGKGFSTGIWVDQHPAGVLLVSYKIPAGLHMTTASLDYALAPAFRGKGIMTRACSAMIEYLFEQIGIHRIEISPDIVNIKSCAIPERLGFTRGALLRNSVNYGTFHEDQVVYRLIRH